MILADSGSPQTPLTRRIRILFLIDGMEALTAGGSERQLLQLIAFMRDAGEEPELCVFRETKWLTKEIAGCPVKFFDLQKLASAAGIAELRSITRWIRAGDFDIVLTMFWEANLLGPVLAKMAGVRVVLGTRRNLNYLLTSPIAALQFVSNHFVTRLLANCEAVKAAVARTEHISARKIDVLYNGIDTSRFRPDPVKRASVRAKLGILENQVLIGNVSTFRPIKGLDLFVSAAALVSKHVPQSRFVLVGDGPERERIETSIQHLGISEVCHVLGAQEEVNAYINGFDLAVLSSYSEGFSNSILEYMASGVPSVVTDVGGNREALGDAGITVPPGDPEALARGIEMLTMNIDLRQHMSLCGLTRSAEHFNLRATQERFHHYLASFLVMHA